MLRVHPSPLCRAIPRPHRLNPPLVTQTRVHQSSPLSRRACASSLVLSSKKVSLLPTLFQHSPLAIMASKTTIQTRSHGGHSAGDHHHHDNTYLTSTNRNDAGVKITRVGLYVNLGMAIVKGVGGYYFNSKALTADAIHSLTDLVSDVMTLATVSFAMKPPSEQFPGGYGKMESLGSLGVSGILLSGGFYMGFAAVLALCQQFIPGFEGFADALGLHGGHHGHDHSMTDLGPNINAAWLAGGSIIIKEWLYRASKSIYPSLSLDILLMSTTALKIAKERKSQVLASNAYHHRVDSLTAFVALLMIAGSNVMENAAWMDPVGGLVISLMVVQAGWGNTKSAILELADVSLSDDMKNKVRRSAENGLRDIGKPSFEVRQVQGIKAGQNYLVDLEVGAPSKFTIAESKSLEEALRNHIGSKVRGVKRVKIRFVPQDSGTPSFTDEFIAADISPRSSPEPEDEDDHKHPHSH